jgi:hypothetical protein
MSKNPEQKAAEEAAREARRHKPMGKVTRRNGTSRKHCGGRRRRKKNSG